MANTDKQDRFQVVSYALHEGEYNLAKEFRRIVNIAFERYPTQTMEFIADQLGISARTLHRLLKDWNIDRKKIKKAKQERRPYRNLALYGTIFDTEKKADADSA